MASAIPPDSADVDDPIPPELEEALHRVMLSETLEFSHSLQSLTNLKKYQNSLNAVKLLAKREIIEASKYNDEDELSYNEERLDELRVQEKEIQDQLYKAFLKHASVADTIQNIAFQTQLQNNFYETLEKDGAEADPLIRSILSNANDNMNSYSDLATAIGEQDQLEEDIFDLRVKYRESLQSIENKWKVVTAQEPSDNRYKNDKAYKELETKFLRREERLSIIVGILQGLISGSGEVWGSNPRILQILLLCEASFSSLGDSLTVRESLEVLQKIRKNPDAPIDSYLTSTPKH